MVAGEGEAHGAALAAEEFVTDADTRATDCALFIPPHSTPLLVCRCVRVCVCVCVVVYFAESQRPGIASH